MSPTPAEIREFDSTAPSPDETETATFGLGCFWGPDAQFGAVEGVVRTRVGYAGGTTPGPTYHELGDHTEVCQVDYDPDVVTYADLLDRVFRSHDPHTQTRKTQYQTVVFAATPAQQETLTSFLEADGYDPDEIETRVEQLSRFYPAEDYHQKYQLRSQAAFADAFESAEYDDEQLRESPAAAKLNGYVAGHDIPPGLELATADDRSVHSG